MRTIVTMFLPMCIGFIISRASRKGDIQITFVGIVAFILDVMLVIRGYS